MNQRKTLVFKNTKYKECVQCIRIELGTCVAYLMQISLHNFDRNGAWHYSHVAKTSMMSSFIISSDSVIQNYELMVLDKS